MWPPARALGHEGVLGRLRHAWDGWRVDGGDSGDTGRTKGEAGEVAVGLHARGTVETLARRQEERRRAWERLRAAERAALLARLRQAEEARVARRAAHRAAEDMALRGEQKKRQKADGKRQVEVAAQTRQAEEATLVGGR